MKPAHHLILTLCALATAIFPVTFPLQILMDLWQALSASDDHGTTTHLSSRPIPHHSMDAGLSGEGGLGRWSQSLGRLVRCVL